MKNAYKTGDNVYLKGLKYLFLGFSDYKKSLCVIADSFGNKVTVFSYRLSRDKNMSLIK